MTETGIFSEVESSIQLYNIQEWLHYLSYHWCQKKCERNPANVAYIAGAEQNQNSKAMQINTPAAAAKRAFVWQK